jgi:hypothetical protein
MDERVELESEGSLRSLTQITLEKTTTPRMNETSWPRVSSLYTSWTPFQRIVSSVAAITMPATARLITDPSRTSILSLFVDLWISGMSKNRRLRDGKFVLQGSYWTLFSLRNSLPEPLDHHHCIHPKRDRPRRKLANDRLAAFRGVLSRGTGTNKKP